MPVVKSHCDRFSPAEHSTFRQHPSPPTAVAGGHDHADRVSMPNPTALLCAMAGQHIEGPLCNLAFKLVDIHRRRIIRPDSDANLLALRIPVLVRIDALTRQLPPPGPTAHPYEPGLARLIDRLAWAAAEAFELLMCHDIGGEQVHRAWTRLAELELEYADLYRDIRAGVRYLPAGTVHAEISRALMSKISRAIPQTRVSAGTD
ncbi:hypothetical protein [Nocardia flavorosea]|uniref:DUF4254 domain-containing protein n=1 Tax=Nocardia flavorosea TaxID=53429 RepID=A0A846Y7Z9_9NOCA|nr:hypothetical protein [Nocardia flavorosea]NKY54977.1 hypothetical protein [Nocardia flavorosea]